MSKEIAIDLDEVVFKVRVGGKEYELREPTIEQIEKYSIGDQADVSSGAKAMKDLLVELGLPKEVTAKMPVRHICKIFETINEVNVDAKKK